MPGTSCKPITGPVNRVNPVLAYPVRRRHFPPHMVADGASGPLLQCPPARVPRHHRLPQTYGLPFPATKKVFAARCLKVKAAGIRRRRAERGRGRFLQHCAARLCSITAFPTPCKAHGCANSRTAGAPRSGWRCGRLPRAEESWAGRDCGSTAHPFSSITGHICYRIGCYLCFYLWFMRPGPTDPSRPHRMPGRPRACRLQVTGPAEHPLSA